MPPIDRLAVLRAILEDGVVPIFTAPDAEVAFDFVAGCAQGGARVVEFTNRGDFAHATFVDLAGFTISQPSSSAEEATRAWIEAGAAALGVGGHLYPPELIAFRDAAEVARRTRQILGWVQDARGATGAPRS